VLIYSRTAFLENAKKNKDVKVSQKTIREVEKAESLGTFRHLMSFDDLLFGNISEVNNYYYPHLNFMRNLYPFDSVGEFQDIVQRIGGVDVARRLLKQMDPWDWHHHLHTQSIPQPLTNNENNTTEQ
jgi:hypothetical protein